LTHIALAYVHPRVGGSRETRRDGRLIAPPSRSAAFRGAIERASQMLDHWWRKGDSSFRSPSFSLFSRIAFTSLRQVARRARHCARDRLVRSAQVPHRGIGGIFNFLQPIDRSNVIRRPSIVSESRSDRGFPPRAFLARGNAPSSNNNAGHYRYTRRYTRQLRLIASTTTLSV